MFPMWAVFPRKKKCFHIWEYFLEKMNLWLTDFSRVFSYFLKFREFLHKSECVALPETYHFIVFWKETFTATEDFFITLTPLACPLLSYVQYSHTSCHPWEPLVDSGFACSGHFRYTNGLFYLTSFTLLVFKVHLYCGTYHNITPFWVYFEAILNKVAINIHIQVFVWTCVLISSG